MLVVPAARRREVRYGTGVRKIQDVRQDVSDVLTLLDVALRASGLEPPHIVLEPHGEGGGEVRHGAQAARALLHHGRGHHVDLGEGGSGRGWWRDSGCVQLCQLHKTVLNSTTVKIV